jgi:hypothetical protein
LKEVNQAWMVVAEHHSPMSNETAPYDLGAVVCND